MLGNNENPNRTAAVSHRAAGSRVVLVTVLAVALLAPAAVGAPATAGAQTTQQTLETSQTPRQAPEGPAPNTVSAYGGARDLGPEERLTLEGSLVGMAPTPSGRGYWLVASDGGVFAFGDAGFFGSAAPAGQEIVAVAAHPSGRGYWLAAAHGSVAAFGEAAEFGSLAGQPLDGTVVGVSSTPSGAGYWLFTSAGGVFAFGDAGFFGSLGGQPLNGPVVGGAATRTGHGYWLVAADGGVFAFGDAQFRGSLGRRQPPRPAVGLAPAGSSGYWVATRDGEVFEFGVDHHGAATEMRADFYGSPVVGIAGPGNEHGYWLLHGEPLEIEAADEGPEVELLQQRLTELGYWLGPATGSFGPLTQQAVYAFQKYEGLPLTGRYDEATQHALDAAARPLAGDPAGDRLEIDKRRQLLFVVRGGRVEWAFNTSTGREEPYTHRGTTYQAETPEGRFGVLREIDGWRTSHLGRLYRPKYFTTTGIAVHGFTSVPPHPASAGCVRVTLAAMDFLWEHDLIPIGSEVWVHGELPAA